MNKRIIVMSTALVAFVGFILFGYVYKQTTPDKNSIVQPLPNGGDILVRPNSPVMGAIKAPVTIVEFFDPACEACRAFYPHVKNILSEHGNSVRLVLRYAPLHEGSEEAVRILETARLQGKFKSVLEALLNAQPVWASHTNPNIEKAWEAAKKAGLDIKRARQETSLPEIDARIKQDIHDLTAVKLRATPTFFVNGKPLKSFGPKQLGDLVRSEVQATSK